MNSIYEYQVENLSGQKVIAQIDLSKVVGILRANGQIVIHFQGSKSTMTLTEMPLAKCLDADEYHDSVERAYWNIVNAWNALKEEKHEQN